MSAEGRIQRLEALLERVRRRAGETRGIARPFSDIQAKAPVAPALTEQARVMAAPAQSIGSLEVDGEPTMKRSPTVDELMAEPAAVVPAVEARAVAPLELVDTPPPEALGEEDLLEISSDMLESIPPSGGVAEVVVDEEPPASSQRTRVAPRVSDLADLGHDVDAEEHEVPLKTPPPESGPQEAPMPSALGAPPVPDVASLLDAPALSHSREEATHLGAPFDSLEAPFDAPSSRPAAATSGPTVEQLGQTIDLGEAHALSLELDRPPTPPPPAPASPEELEVPLPAREPGGAYDAALLPPLEAQTELASHEAAPLYASAAAPEPEFSGLGALPPPVTLPVAGEQMSAAGVSPLAATVPEVIERPALSTVSVIEFKAPTTPSSRPTTFMELLDASIALGE